MRNLTYWRLRGSVCELKMSRFGGCLKSFKKRRRSRTVINVCKAVWLVLWRATTPVSIETPDFFKMWRRRTLLDRGGKRTASLGDRPPCPPTLESSSHDFTTTPRHDWARPLSQIDSSDTNREILFICLCIGERRCCAEASTIGHYAVVLAVGGVVRGVCVDYQGG